MQYLIRGSALVVSLLFLFLMSLLIIESNNSTRLYYKASFNRQAYDQLRNMAKETCDLTVDALERYLKGGSWPPENLLSGVSYFHASSNPLELRVDIEDLGSSILWPKIVSYKRGQLVGEARINSGKVLLLRSGYQQNQFDTYISQNFQRALNKVNLELRCEGKSENNNIGPAWVMLDYQFIY